MVHIHDPLLDAGRTAVDTGALLAFAVGKPMQAEQIAILGLDNVLLGLVAKQPAQLDKVGRVADRVGYGCGSRSSQTEAPVDFDGFEKEK